MLREEEYKTLSLAIYEDLISTNDAGMLELLTTLPPTLMMTFIEMLYRHAYETGFRMGRGVIASERFQHN